MNTLLPLPGAPAWFLALLDYSLQAAALCGLVFVLTKTLGRWIPPAFRALLWFLVIARVLIPFAPPSQFSFQNLFAKPPQIVEAPAPVFARTQLLETSIEVPDFSFPEPARTFSHPMPAPAPPFPAGRALAFAWIFTAATCLLVLAVRCLIIHRRLTRDTTRPSAEILAALKTRYPIRISASARIAAPALTGLLPARLIVPKNFDQFTPAQIRHILLHELAHIRQGHLLLHWLALIARALHWFNPAVHFAATRLRFECELAADAAALKNSTDTERAAYAQTILQILAQATLPSTRLALPMAEKVQLERRLRAVTQPGRNFRLLGLVTLLALSIAGLSSADRTLPKPLSKIPAERQAIGHDLTLIDKERSEAPQAAATENLQPGEVRVQVFIIDALTNALPDLITPIFGPLNLPIQPYAFTNFSLPDSAIHTLTNRAVGSQGVDFITHPAQTVMLGRQVRFEFNEDFMRLGTNTPVGAESIPTLDIIPYHSPRSGLEFSVVYTFNTFLGVQTNEQSGQALPTFHVRQHQLTALPISPLQTHILYFPARELQKGSKFPVLGDIPLVGRLFRSKALEGSRASIFIIRLTSATSSASSKDLAAELQELQKTREKARQVSINRAHRYLEMDQFDKAEAIFNEELKRDPNDPMVLNYLNLIRKRRLTPAVTSDSRPQLGQIENAESSLREMLQETPGSNSALDGLRRSRENSARSYLSQATNNSSRQRLLRQLVSIRIDDFPITTNIDLVVILKEISTEIKKRDPEGRGINLLVAPKGEGPNSNLASGETFQIRFDPPVRDLTLRQFLDAIVKVARPPAGDAALANTRLRYSIEDYAVVFYVDKSLTTRRYRVPAENFMRNGEQLGVSAIASELRSRFAAVGVHFPTNAVPERSNSAAGDSDIEALFSTNLLAGNPVTGPLPQSNAMFYSFGAGMLHIRASAEDLDKIEQVIERILRQPRVSQINPEPFRPERIETDPRVRDARLHIEMGRLDEAEAMLKDVVKENPENRAAFYYLNLIKEQRHVQEIRRREITTKDQMVEIEKSWNVRPTNTFGNPRSATNATGVSAFRQALYRKLDTIRIDDFPPMNSEVDLVEVLKELSSEIKKRDPGGKGLNLLIAPAADRRTVDGLDPVTGLPAAAPVNLERFKIKFDPPIRDVTLKQFLDAIVMVAKPEDPNSRAGLKYTVEDYAIVFTQRPDDGSPEPLYTKRFRMDPTTFDKALEGVVFSPNPFQGLTAQRPIVSSNSTSNNPIVRGMRTDHAEYSTDNGVTWKPLQQGVVLSNTFGRFLVEPPPQPAPPLRNVPGFFSFGGGGQQQGGAGVGIGVQGGQSGASITFVTIITNTSAIQSKVRAFFAAAGVDFPTNTVGQGSFQGGFPGQPGNAVPQTKAMFFNDRAGMLFVRATLRDLDIIEQALHALNVAPK